MAVERLTEAELAAVAARTRSHLASIQVAVIDARLARMGTSPRYGAAWEASARAAEAAERAALAEVSDARARLLEARAQVRATHAAATRSARGLGAEAPERICPECCHGLRGHDEFPAP